MVIGLAPWWMGQTERTSFLTQGAAMYSCYSLYFSSVRLYRITNSAGNDLSNLFAGLQGLENCFAALALAILFSVIPDYLVG
jgi:hypothetical protein